MNVLTRVPPALLRPATGLALLVAMAAATAESPPDDAAPQPVKDAWLDGRLETSYALNPYLNPFDIDTRVENGVVKLSGTVSSDIDRDLAVEIAEGLNGVSKVESALTVDSERARSAPMSDDGRSFPQWIKDATTTARVKSNLIANGNTRGLAINVDTRNDVVTLKGAVSSRKEKMLAEMIARNTDGIASVTNQLEIAGKS